MLHGYVFHVQYPRLANQNYVCTDPAFVVNDIMVSVRDCGWRLTVSLIPFKGPTALAITYHVGDLVESHPTLGNWFNVIAGELVSTNFAKKE